MKIRKLCEILAFFVVTVSAVFAGPITDIGLFATGVNASGVALTSGNDLHYLFNGSNIPVVASAGIPSTNPVPYNWLGATTTSAWIAPVADVSTMTTPSGAIVYTYTTTFDLTGYDLSSPLLISGNWAVDNFGSIFLNSSSTALNTVADDPSAYNSWHAFTITGSSAGLVAGLNTIKFTTTNSFASEVNPAGLRVVFDPTFTGTLIPSAIPEPGTLALLGGGLLALGLFRRWR